MEGEEFENKMRLETEWQWYDLWYCCPERCFVTLIDSEDV